MCLSIDTVWRWPAERCLEAVWYVISVVKDMLKLGYGYDKWNVDQLPGRLWLSDSETDDVFLVS